jgi:hypothetical protein
MLTYVPRLGQTCLTAIKVSAFTKIFDPEEVFKKPLFGDPFAQACFQLCYGFFAWIAVLGRVARWLIFRPKIPILVNFFRPWNGKIGSTLWPFWYF